MCEESKGEKEGMKETLLNHELVRFVVTYVYIPTHSCQCVYVHMYIDDEHVYTCMYIYKCIVYGV